MKNFRVKQVVFIIAILLVAGLTIKLAGKVAAAPDQEPGEKNNNGHEPHAAVCVAGDPDSARCHARVVVDEHGLPKAVTAPSGYGPVQFLGAYNLSGTAGSNQTIAIVDAYDDPNIFSDLNNYSAYFGLPGLVNCPVAGGTVNSPCFQKVNQNGGSTYPSVNSGWSLEIALDVEVAHAICQNCNILLVEANSNSFTNLMAAVDRARLMGATVISNSYGGSEFSGESAYDSHFNYPGIAFTFSSGDSGYGTQYPASSPYVTAVGGTTLNLAGNSYVSESAWNGAGSGCSSYEPQPAFQSSLGLVGCANRMVADVAADANPSTGAAVYDSVRYQGKNGWFKVGGTSLAAPLVAGVYALAGGVSAGVTGNSLPYSLGSYGNNLHDVIGGSNGTCSTGYLCSSVVGYDGPTGLGSPLGWAAF